MKDSFRSYVIIGIIAILLFSGLPSVSAELFQNMVNKYHSDSLGPGDYLDFIFFDGLIRSYRLHVPPTYDGKDEMPLVFALHGSGIGANSKSIKPFTSIDAKADEEGFIVVYPNGEFLRLSSYYNHPISFVFDLYSLIRVSREWNRWDDNSVDDVGFIRILMDHLQDMLKINSSRIYVMGISGGAMMTYRLGSELSNRIAAIAPIAGVIGGIGYTTNKDESQNPYIIPKPETPVPVISFNGMKDKAVPYEGGWKQVFSWGSDELWVYLVSVNESITFWIEHNNCNPDPLISKSESGKIIIESYLNDNKRSDVVLVSYLDGGHEWFTSPPYELSAIDLMWDFFRNHSK